MPPNPLSSNPSLESGVSTLDACDSAVSAPHRRCRTRSRLDTMSEYSPLFVCASFSPIAGLPQQNSARVHRLRPVTPFAMRKRLAVMSGKKVEPVFDELTKISYQIVESSSPGHHGGLTLTRGKRLLLRLKHDVQGDMSFQVSDSNDGLSLGHCGVSCACLLEL